MRLSKSLSGYWLLSNRIFNKCIYFYETPCCHHLKCVNKWNGLLRYTFWMSKHRSELILSKSSWELIVYASEKKSTIFFTKINRAISREIYLIAAILSTVSRVSVSFCKFSYLTKHLQYWKKIRSTAAIKHWMWVNKNHPMLQCSTKRAGPCIYSTPS